MFSHTIPTHSFITRGILECLLGFRPLGRNPAGAIKRKLHGGLKIWILFSRVKNNILLVRKILSLPLENKIHIFAPPCNILNITIVHQLTNILSSAKKIYKKACECPLTENMSSNFFRLALFKRQTSWNAQVSCRWLKIYFPSACCVTFSMSSKYSCHYFQLTGGRRTIRHFKR